MYAENQQANGPKYYPHPFHPTDPGLFFLGSGDGVIALFLGMADSTPDGRIFAYTYQQTWLEFTTDVVSLLVSIFRGETDLWQFPDSGLRQPWSFEPDEPDDDETSLMDAVLLGNLDLVRSLVSAGANVNEVSDYNGGDTLLCSIDDERMLRALLELGADPNQANGLGRTPLTVACSSHLPAGGVLALLEAGANPNVADSTGTTPLIWACSCADLAKSELLLRFGADPNTADQREMTPMKRAQSTRRFKLR